MRFLKVILILVVAFSFNEVMHGQKITVSEEIFLKNDYAYDILGKVGEHFLMFRDQGHKFQVMSFDDELRKNWEREIFFEKRKVDIIGVLRKGDYFNIIYGFNKKGIYNIRHHRYDGTVSVVDTGAIALYDNSYFTPKFLMARSEDRSKVVIFRTDRDSEMDMFVYDIDDMKLMWTKKLRFKNTYLRRDFRKMIVNNQGDMYLVLEHDKFVKKNRFVEIIAVRASDGDIIVKEVQLDELIPSGIFAEYDEMNRELVLTGMYSDKNYAKVKGLYFSTVALSDRVVDINIIPFDEQLLGDVYGKEVNKNKGLTNFDVQEVVLRQDGGAMIIAEMNKEYSRRPNTPVRRDYNSYTRGAWVDYYFEDVIVFSIHPDGSEHWKTVLHKRQYSQDDDAMYSSFFLFKTPMKIRLLYNDEIRQENTVSEYVIRGNGKTERNSVFSTDYQRLRLRFRDAIQTSFDECIVPSERNNRLNLVRIKY